HSRTSLSPLLFSLTIPPPPPSTLFPYTTLFRSTLAVVRTIGGKHRLEYPVGTVLYENEVRPPIAPRVSGDGKLVAFFDYDAEVRSEEHTSELQSLRHLVCRLLLEKKKSIW